MLQVILIIVMKYFYQKIIKKIDFLRIKNFWMNITLIFDCYFICCMIMNFNAEFLYQKMKIIAKI